MARLPRKFLGKTVEQKQADLKETCGSCSGSGYHVDTGWRRGAPRCEEMHRHG